MLRDYTLLTARELAAETYFQDWILNPAQEHRQFWTQFLLEHPDREHVVEEARLIVVRLRAAFEQPPTDPAILHGFFDEVLQEIQPQLHRIRSDRGPMQQVRIRKVALRRWTIAATWLLLAGTVAIFWQFSRPLTYETAFGEWKTVVLPDESVMHMNANSSVKIASTWKDGEDRKVWLQGEAFFEVKKKPETGATFSVITEDLSVEVLGTAFNVSTRKEKTSVYLEEGSVRLNLGQNIEVMEPGNLVVYSSEQEEVIERDMEASHRVSAWYTGVLNLEKRAVKDVADELAALYGVEVVLKDPQLGDRVITARLPLKKLDVVVPILELVLGTEVVLTGDNRLIIK